MHLTTLALVLLSPYALPLPDGLVWVCAYSDEPTRCHDVVFESPTVVDCGNPRALTDYEGGSGTMILTDAVGQPHVYRYTSRSWQQWGGPGSLPAVKLFPDGGEFPASRDGFEAGGCVIYERE